MTQDSLSKFTELSADLLEPVLDSITDNQILKDIPVLSSAVKVAELGRGISDRIFLAKIHRFLNALEPTASPEAQKFAEELASGDVDASRTAETLLLAIDSTDDLEKAPIIAAVFQAFLRGGLDKVEFRRIIAAINASVVEDLLEIATLGSEPEGSSESYSTLLTSLSHTGLTTSNEETYIRSQKVDLTKAVTPLGKAFARAIESRNHSK